MSIQSTRSAALLALLAIAPAVHAQSGVRISISTSTSGNNSDNSGFNVGGSQVAGNTFGPQNSNAGSGSTVSIPPTGTSFATVAGGKVSIVRTGTFEVSPTGSLGAATSQLSEGIVKVGTAGGGSVTVTMSRDLGRALAQTISPDATASVTSADAARLSTAIALEAAGLDRASAVQTANALLEVSRMQAAQRGLGEMVPAPMAAPAPAPAPRAEEGRARPSQQIPMRKDVPTPSGPPTPAPTPAPAAVVEATPAPAMMMVAPSTSAAMHAAAAVSQMTQAIETYMGEFPGTPLPAPLLAAGLVVRTAAASALPLPASMRR